MEYGVDFTITPLPKRCLGQKRTLKPTLSKDAIVLSMDKEKREFKYPPEIRRYWAEAKREQRKRKKEAKTHDKQ